MTLSYRNRPYLYAHYLLGWLFGPNPCLGTATIKGQVGSGVWGVAWSCASITKCCLRYLLQIQGYLRQQIKTATPLSDRKGSGTFARMPPESPTVSHGTAGNRWTSPECWTAGTEVHVREH